MNHRLIKILKQLKKETPEQTDLKTLTVIIVENTAINNPRGLKDMVNMFIMLGALEPSENGKVFTLNHDVIGRLIGEKKA